MNLNETEGKLRAIDIHLGFHKIKEREKEQTFFLMLTTI